MGTIQMSDIDRVSQELTLGNTCSWQKKENNSVIPETHKEDTLPCLPLPLGPSHHPWHLSLSLPLPPCSVLDTEARAILFKPKSKKITPLLKTFHTSHFAEREPVHPSLVPLMGPPVAPSVLTRLQPSWAFLLLQSTLGLLPASGTLHLLFPLPGLQRSLISE